jgi:hypothetical protein
MPSGVWPRFARLLRVSTQRFGNGDLRAALMTSCNWRMSKALTLQLRLDVFDVVTCPDPANWNARSRADKFGSMPLIQQETSLIPGRARVESVAFGGSSADWQNTMAS